MAVPSDVADILAGLSYEGLVPGNADTLIMDVYDGVGDQCLDEREHEAWKNNWRTDTSSQNQYFQSIFYGFPRMLPRPIEYHNTISQSFQ